MAKFRGFFLLFCIIAEITSLPLHDEVDPELESGSEENDIPDSVKLLLSEYVVRKCCGIGQVLHFGNGIKQCANSSRQDWVSQFNQNTVRIGLPQNCDENDLVVLNPAEAYQDRYFMQPSGHLVVPDRFWVLSPEENCMDDIVLEKDSEPEHNAIVCTKRVKEMSPGPLEFTKEYLSLQNKHLVHKCCGSDQVYSVNNQTCIAKENYSSSFMNQMVESEEYLLQMGQVTCDDLIRTTDFQLSPSGKLEVQRYEGEMIAVNSDDYCLEDFVTIWDNGVADTRTMVNYCPYGNQPSEVLPELDDIDSKSELDKCEEDNLMVLKPNESAASEFFILKNGQLVVPHRFWILSPNQYSLEGSLSADSIQEETATICTEHVEEFPLNASDDYGRLQLDFLETDDKHFSRLDGKTIVHKCCDLHEVYLLNNLTCIPNKGYSTKFLDQLVENDDYFFRVGDMKCDDPIQTDGLAVQPSGQLELRRFEGERLRIHPDEYCLDDFVIIWDNGLSDATTMVKYCQNDDPRRILQLEN